MTVGTNGAERLLGLVVVFVDVLVPPVVEVVLSDVFVPPVVEVVLSDVFVPSVGALSVVAGPSPPVIVEKSSGVTFFGCFVVTPF